MLYRRDVTFQRTKEHMCATDTYIRWTTESDRTTSDRGDDETKVLRQSHQTGATFQSENGSWCEFARSQRTTWFPYRCNYNLVISYSKSVWQLHDYYRNKQPTQEALGLFTIDETTTSHIGSHFTKCLHVVCLM